MVHKMSSERSANKLWYAKDKRNGALWWWLFQVLQWMVWWLQKKVRLDVQEKQGEKLFADFEGAKSWLENRLPVNKAEFHPMDIFNCDETGLYWRGLPDRGFVPGNVVAPGAKVAKDRITVLICCNADGSEKIPLFFIGNAAQPRKFPKDHSLLPVTYAANKNAWMTQFLFNQFLSSWDRKLRLEKRKIIQMMDNATSHHCHALSNIALEFMPPNTTSLVTHLRFSQIDNGLSPRSPPQIVP